MTIQEMSDQFDLLYNNITSNQAPGLNEWEKSVFLTKAQSQLVKEYFNQRVDAIGGGFDGSQKRQYDFSGLIRTESLFNINTYADRVTIPEKLDRRSQVYLFPTNYFLAVNEIISDTRWQYSVAALDYAEYQRLMLKPYSLPVKRAAWRLITDKKNCNYCREYVESTELVSGSTTDYRDTDTDYVILTSWADQKRNLSVTIKFTRNNSLPLATNQDYPGVDDGTFYFMYDTLRASMFANCEWDSNQTYHCTLSLECGENLDDEEVMEALKIGFSEYKKYLAANNSSVTTASTDMAKACRHLDGLAMCSAPSEYTNFKTLNGSLVVGKTFTTSVIQIPFAEIIGKFEGDISYKLRYVRTLEPIILDDLYNYGDDLTIDGIRQKTACKLPEECHEEILERAVTLAKIAWQGGTATMAQQANNSRN